MNKLLAALAITAAIAPAALAQGPYPPVPPLQEEVGPPPVPPGPPAQYILVPGNWQWNGVSYVWVGRHWILRQPGYVHWVPGHWAAGGPRGWHWVPGHWKG